jgi:hypothetical protein
MEGSNVYDAVWPSGRQVVSGAKLAKRLDTLEGKVVAELWDWIFKGDVMFKAFEDELSRRYSGMKFIHWKEFDRIHGPNAKEALDVLPERLKKFRVDCLVCGVGC